MKSDDENEVFDAEGLYAFPGLIDIHFHGCVSADVCDGSQEAIQKLQIMSILGNYDGKSGLKLIGINMESQFISRKKKVLRLRKMSSRVMWNSFPDCKK